MSSVIVATGPAVTTTEVALKSITCVATPVLTWLTSTKILVAEILSSEGSPKKVTPSAAALSEVHVTPS